MNVAGQSGKNLRICGSPINWKAVTPPLIIPFLFSDWRICPLSFISTDGAAASGTSHDYPSCLLPHCRDGPTRILLQVLPLCPAATGLRGVPSTSSGKTAAAVVSLSLLQHESVRVSRGSKSMTSRPLLPRTPCCWAISDHPYSDDAITSWWF